MENTLIATEVREVVALTDAIFETGASGVPIELQQSFIYGGDFRVIVCSTPTQMNDFCDLLGKYLLRMHQFQK